MPSEYWPICVEEAIGELEIAATDEQIEMLAERMQIAHETRAEYSPAPSPDRGELERAKALLQAEKEKFDAPRGLCPRCKGKGRTAGGTTTYFCWNQCASCSGEGFTTRPTTNLEKTSMSDEINPYTGEEDELFAACIGMVDAVSLVQPGNQELAAHGLCQFSDAVLEGNTPNMALGFARKSMSEALPDCMYGSPYRLPMSKFMEVGAGISGDMDVSFGDDADGNHRVLWRFTGGGGNHRGVQVVLTRSMSLVQLGRELGRARESLLILAKEGEPEDA